MALFKFTFSLVLVFFIGGASAPQAMAYEGHSLAAREPYLPQKYDFGVALGSAFNSSNYAFFEIFSGFQTTSCAHHCFDYIDLSGRALVQNGETNYQALIGWRFQKFFDDSMWGPYLRPFGGIEHYLYQGQVKDLGVGGLALGTYYFLHPGADLRLEVGEAVGPISWTYLTLGFVFKFRNI
jgi:hypothetical protein